VPTVIHTYTRAQAIEDGVLIDVSEMAREAGFRWPVAVHFDEAQCRDSGGMGLRRAHPRA